MSSLCLCTQGAHLAISDHSPGTKYEIFQPFGSVLLPKAIPEQKSWLRELQVHWEGCAGAGKGCDIPRKPRKCTISQCLGRILLPSHCTDTARLLNSAAPNTRAIPDLPPSSSSATPAEGVPWKAKVPARCWSLQLSNPS